MFVPNDFATQQLKWRSDYGMQPVGPGMPGIAPHPTQPQDYPVSILPVPGPGGPSAPGLAPGGPSILPVPPPQGTPIMAPQPGYQQPGYQPPGYQPPGAAPGFPAISMAAGYIMPPVQQARQPATRRPRWWPEEVGWPLRSGPEWLNEGLGQWQ